MVLNMDHIEMRYPTAPYLNQCYWNSSKCNGQSLHQFRRFNHPFRFQHLPCIHPSLWNSIRCSVRVTH